MQDNGSWVEIPVNRGGRGPCEAPPKPPVVFAVNKLSAKTPLKSQLTAIARQVAPSVYTIADKTKSHQDFYAIYRGERLIFIGNAQSGKVDEGTKVLGYRQEQDGIFGGVVAALEFEGKNIHYALTSTGRMVSGSAKQVRAIPYPSPDSSPCSPDPPACRH